MFAKKQSDMLLIPGLKRCAQRPVRTACPLRHRGQAIQHRIDDLRVTAIQSHSKKIVPIIGLRFCMKSGCAHEKQPEHVDIAVRCSCHQGGEAARIGEINKRACIDESPRSFPILLRCRDQQWRSSARVAAIWIDTIHQVQVNQSIAVQSNSSNQLAG